MQLNHKRLVLIALVLILSSLFLFVVLPRLLPKVSIPKHINQLNQQISVPDNALPSDVEMTWGGLTVTIPQGSINQKSEALLYLGGYVLTNQYDYVGNYELVIRPSDPNLKNSLSISKPIALSFDLNTGFSQDALKNCGFDINTASFYIKTADRNSLELYDKTLRLQSTINNKTKKITASIPQQYLVKDGYVDLFINIGVSPTKYLYKCGPDNQAYIENNTVYNKLGKYKIKLPTNADRPIVNEGLVSNSTSFTVNNESYPFIELVSIQNWQGLETSQLGKLQYPGYERVQPGPINEGESVITKGTLKINGKEFYQTISTIDDKEIYRLITTYNNKEDVLILETTLYTKDYGSLSQKYITIIKEVASTLSNNNQ